MLGEAALTTARTRERYLAAYADGDRRRSAPSRGRARRRRDARRASRSSCRRCIRATKFAQRERACWPSSCPRSRRSPGAPRGAGIGLTIDAEESRPAGAVARRVRARLRRDPRARRLARARPRGAGVPEARAAASSNGSRRSRATPAAAFMVRLVKGAYWDTEIKRAQVLGLDGLSGVHAQGAHRRLVPGLRAGDARDARRALSAVRHAQRAHRSRPCSSWREAVATRSSSSACTAWARRCTTR